MSHCLRNNVRTVPPFLSTLPVSSSCNSEMATPSDSNLPEIARDQLHDNISPFITDAISNALNVIALLEAFSGMIPAPPFIESIFTLVKVIVKTVQVPISCGSRSSRGFDSLTELPEGQAGQEPRAPPHQTN